MILTLIVKTGVDMATVTQIDMRPWANVRYLTSSRTDLGVAPFAPSKRLIQVKTRTH